jgi:hypothetical protein
MIGLLCCVLAVVASPFKSKLRLQAENAVPRHQLIDLPGPYYSLAEVVEWRCGWLLGRSKFDPDGDSHYRRSWFAEALFFLIARRNYRSSCQLLWPTLTRFMHVRTRLSEATDFGPSICPWRWQRTRVDRPGQFRARYRSGPSENEG